jgi:hypothetical protein
MQMGVERGEGSGDRDGWAWIGEAPGQDDGGVLEAYRLADFVHATLRMEVSMLRRIRRTWL